MWTAIKGAFGIGIGFLAPWASAALAVIETVATAIWRFIRQPPGSYVALALAVALAWVASGQLGYHRGRVICEATHQAAADHEKQRQKVAIAAAKTSSEIRTAAHAETDANNKQQVIYVTRTIASRPDGGVECIDAASADRLRAIQ